MDAKPSRPTRPNVGANIKTNTDLPFTKTLHQRHKSTGNLVTMSSNGTFNHTAKRTALGDRNGVARGVGDTKDGAKATAQTRGVASAAVALNTQENRFTANPKGAANKKATLAQPAQRVPRIAASMSQLRPFPNTQKDNNKSTFVFKDQDEKLEEKSYLSINPAASEKLEVLQEPETDTDVGITTEETTKEVSDAQVDLEKESLEDTASVEPTSQLLEQCQLEDKEEPSDDPIPEKSQHTGPVTLRESPLLVTYVENPSGLAASANGEISETYDPPYVDAVEHFGNQAADDVSELSNVPVTDEPALFIPFPETFMEQIAAVKNNANAETSTSPEIPLRFIDSDEELYGEANSTTHTFRGDNTTTGITAVMMPPKLTKRGQAEMEAAKQIVLKKKTIAEMQEDAWDVSMVAEYGDEIFQYMREVEMTLLPNPHYMDIQTEIQWSMRSVLLDWVVQVHTRFGLYPETLFLAINCIDRFLGVKVVSLGKLQLVGATAIFVAAKYEEINCPSVQEIAYMVDGGYTIDEILKAERFMLTMLEFEMGWPGPMSFLRRISKADDYDLESRTLAKYFLEVAAMDERFVASPASYIASGAHCLSRLILRKGGWTASHVHYSGYTYAQLKPLVTVLLECCRHARQHHAAVFDKYADKRYRAASLFVHDEIMRGFFLPFQPRLSLHSSADVVHGDFMQGPSYHESHSLQMPIPTHC